MKINAISYKRGGQEFCCLTMGDDMGLSLKPCTTPQLFYWQAAADRPPVSSPVTLLQLTVVARFPSEVVSHIPHNGVMLNFE